MRSLEERGSESKRACWFGSAFEREDLKGWCRPRGVVAGRLYAAFFWREEAFSAVFRGEVYIHTLIQKCLFDMYRVQHPDVTKVSERKKHYSVCLAEPDRVWVVILIIKSHPGQ